MHVAPYFAPAFAFGGPPRSILALCHAQQAAGLEVEVFTTTATGGTPLTAVPEGTLYEGVPVRYFATRGWPAMFWAPSLGPALARAARNADLVHTHGLFNAPAWQARRSAIASGRPLVVSVRGMLEPRARAHHPLRKRISWLLLDRHVCADAALFHTTSPGETASVKATIADAPIAEIPNAVDVSLSVDDAARRALRERIGAPSSSPLVVFLGRLHPIKRLDLLARAFALVARRHPDAMLVVAGDGDYRARADAEAHLGDANKRAIWLGAVGGDERDALLAEAAVFVLCSDSENFGMGVAEALAFGVVPVVTRTCPWQVLETERAGFWVAQTADAIAAGIEQVLGDPETARRMGERGQALARERFGRPAVGAAWVAAYAEVLATASR